MRWNRPTRSSFPMLLLLLALLPPVGGPPRAQQTEPEPAVDGGIAPVNTWYVEGGAASRARVTRTPPVTGKLGRSWLREFEGEVEGEPVVWGDWVVVGEHRGTDRYLHLLDLADGESLGPAMRFKTSVPLCPSIWNRTVVVRAEPDKLAAFRIVDRKLRRVWDYGGAGPMSAPLLFRHELYVRDGGDVLRLRIHQSDPVWRVQGNYRGDLALSGDLLYSLGYGGTGGGSSVAGLARQSGKGEQWIEAYDRRGAPPAPGVLAGVVAGERFVFVSFPHGVQFQRQDGTEFSTGWSFGSRSADGKAPRWLDPIHAVLPPAVWQKSFLTVVDQPGLGRGLLLGQLDPDPDTEGLVVWTLAQGALHPQYLKDAAPPSVAGQVAFFGTYGVDLESLRIVWRNEAAGGRVAIPARESVLLVHDRSIERLVSARAAAADPHFYASADEQRVPGARVILRDGSVLSGTVTLRPDAGGLLAGRSNVDLDTVLWVEDGRQRPVFIAGTRSADPVVAQLYQMEVAEAYGGLVREVLATNDIELIEQYLGEAHSANADDAALRSAQRKLDTLRRLKALRVRDSAVERARESHDLLHRDAARAVWTRVEGLPDDTPMPLRLALLRAVLARQPDLAPAVEATEKLLGARTEVSTPLRNVVDWVDFLGAAEQVPIEFIRPDGGETQTRQELQKLRASWRQDVIGVQSRQLFVLSTPDHPGGMARCLSVGELVCDTLEQMFADAGAGGAGGAERPPLELLLFESKAAYLANSSRGAGEEVDPVLAWSAGHYNPVELVSRMYLPAGAEAFAQVMPVFVHELTHHWVDQRCPLLGGRRAPAEQRALQPGYWIVEGFASFVEEFVFDAAARTHDTENPYSDCLDVLAHADSTDTVNWDDVFSVSQVRLQSQDTTAVVKVPVAWILGRVRRLSIIHLFYDQSAAACHYLYHAEDGKLRRALLDYVGSYYTGAAARLDVEQAFGMTPKELGGRIVEYAKQRVR